MIMRTWYDNKLAVGVQSYSPLHIERGCENTNM